MVFINTGICFIFHFNICIVFKKKFWCLYSFFNYFLFNRIMFVYVFKMCKFALANGFLMMLGIIMDLMIFLCGFFIIICF